MVRGVLDVNEEGGDPRWEPPIFVNVTILRCAPFVCPEKGGKWQIRCFIATKEQPTAPCSGCVQDFRKQKLAAAGNIGIQKFELRQYSNFWWI